MKCIYNGKLIQKGEVKTSKAIVFDEKIREIIEEKEAMGKDYEYIDARGNYIAPGLIDLHIHGYHKVDTMDGNKEAIETIAKGIAANGVTAFLPTTMTMSKEAITKALEAVRVAKQEQQDGAQILGVHMEGPYINEVYKGAQNPKYIMSPDQNEIDYVKSYKDVLKLITIAPEVDGALHFIRTISEETDIVLSMGHSAATFEEAMAGIASGIKHTTHLFNGQTALHHRDPGVVGASLASDISAEVICDTIHVHYGLFPFLVKVKGPDRLILVTDCMCAGGCEDGEYALGGQKVIVKEGAARIESGALAGSILPLNVALRNMIDHSGLPVEKAIQFATFNPATLIHVEKEKGSLEVGKDADVIVFDERINILKTINRGKILFEA